LTRLNVVQNSPYLAPGNSPVVSVLATETQFLIPLLERIHKTRAAVAAAVRRTDHD
jgi:hypothetical protein